MIRKRKMSDRSKIALATMFVSVLSTCAGTAGCLAAPPAVLPTEVLVPAEPSVEAVAARLAGATVRVLGEGGHGSGFSFRPGWVATARHVAPDGALVIGSDGDLCPVADRFDHPGADVSLLRVPTCEHLTAVSETAPAVTGAWVMSAGYPLHPRWPSVSVGIVSSDRALVGGDRFLQVDAPLNPGVSGGPLVDRKGRLVGVANGIASYDGMWAGVGYATPADLLVELWDAVEAWGS